MSNELPPGRDGTGTPDGAIQRDAGTPPRQPKAAAELLPREQSGAAPCTPAPDAAETPSATRDVPEPDSLGG